MGGKRLYLVTLVALLVAEVACAYRAAPTPTLAPAAPTPVPGAATKTATSPEDAAWDKVVEVAKKEGRVTIYTFHFTGDAGRMMMRAFEDKYGIKLEIVGGVGSILMERIRSERAAKKYIADILTTSVEFVYGMKKDGLTQSFGELPVLRETGVWEGPPQAEPEGHILSEGSLVFNVPYVNMTVVKAGEEPKSFRELLEPKWKGKVLIGAPYTVPGTVRFYVAMRKYGVLDDSYWRALARQEPKMAPNIRDLDFMVAKGEMPLSLVSSVVTMSPFIKEGAPAKPLAMAEGTLSTSIGNGMGLLNNPPHPNASKLFANWLLSAEGQTIYHQARGSRSIRKDTPDFIPVAGRVAPQKILPLGLPLLLEASSMENVGTLAKLLGIEK